MSCNNIDNLIPRGNDFYLAVTLKSREMVDGQVVVTAFDFDDCDNYDARIYGILRGNTLGTLVGLKDGTTDTVIIDAKDIPLNVAIAVEVTGKKDGRAFRAAEKGFIGIVEYNGQAHVIFTPVTGGQEASLVMTLQFLPSAAVVGKNAYEIWKEQPGNEDKTLEDFIDFLGHGESAYEIAVRYGYTGTEEEYNALYFDAVQAANDAAALVDNRIDTIDEQMSHLCYHDSGGETVEPADFDPEADTVHVTAQTLSSAQKQQARENIGAGTSSFSGSYDDLTNKPTIPAAQVNADWNAASGVAQILNKPAIPEVDTAPTSGSSNCVTSGGVYTALQGKADKVVVETSMPSGGFLPNKVYNLGTLSGNTTFSMAAATDNTIANIWCWTFTTPSSVPTITWSGITGWSGGSAPTINASKSYEVSVMNGIAVIIEV